MDDRTQTTLATLMLFASDHDKIWLQWVYDGCPQPEPPQVRMVMQPRRGVRLSLAIARAQDALDKHMTNALLGRDAQGFWDEREGQREALYETFEGSAS